LAAAFCALTAFEVCGPYVNPVVMIARIVSMPPDGGALWGVSGLVTQYCRLHIGAGLILMSAAGFALGGSAGPPGSRTEPAGVRLTTLPAAPSLAARPRLSLRPPVGQDALLWKELHFSNRTVGTVFRTAGIIL